MEHVQRQEAVREAVTCTLGQCLLMRYVSFRSRMFLQGNPRPKAKSLWGSGGETWEPHCQGLPLPPAVAPEEQFINPTFLSLRRGRG